MILVTGASGHVGGELVAQLAEQGRRVRATVRDPRKCEAPAGVEAAAGDLGRPESLPEAMAGVDGVFLLGGFGDTPVLPTVRDLTGRLPRTFEEWATAHAEAFR